MQPSLVIEAHKPAQNAPIATHRFDRDVIKIGRLPTAEIRLDEPSAARIHCIMQARDGGREWFLSDMGSALGTLLNGAPAKNAKLKDGDRVRIGATELVVRFDRPALVAEPLRSAPVAPIVPAPIVLPRTPLFDPGAAAFARASTPPPTVDTVLTLEPPAPALERRALELRLYWGDVLLDVRHLQETKTFTIGETGSCDVFVSSEDLPKEELPLLRCKDGDYLLTLFDGLTGELASGGTRTRLEDLNTPDDDALPDCRAFTLPADARVIAHWGGLSFALRFVTPPERVAAPWTPDFAFLNSFVVVLFLVAGSIFSLSLYPYEAIVLDETLLMNDVHFTTLREPEKPKPELDAANRLLEELDKKTASAAAPAQPRPTKEPKGGGRAPTKNPSESGVLGALRRGAFADILRSSSEVTSALDDVHAPGVAAVGQIDTRGKAGLESGNESTLGLPRRGPDTRGRLGGDAEYGEDQGKLSPHQDVEPVLADAPPDVHGSMPPELIKRVMQDNRNAFRYCYERELQIKKDLAGVVKVQFVIGALGKVLRATAKESTLHDDSVDQCLLTRVRALQFPKPEGGGVVVVNYPFVFRSTQSR